MKPMTKNTTPTLSRGGFIPIIIICFTLVYICINTGKFIYPNLQLYFSFTFCAIILAGITCIWSLIKKNKIELSLPGILMTIWGIYIVLHSIFVKPAIDYQVIYLLSSILYYYSLTFFFKKHVISFEQIYVFFAWMGVLQAIVCLFQFTGLVNSGDPNFQVKGTFYNPNISAMYIAVSMPFFITKLIHENKKSLNSIVLVLLFFALIVLKCRTAYVGLIIIASTYFISETHLRKLWNRVLKKLKFVIIFITVTLLCGLFVLLYFQKQASADGRVFVWKVSTEMIKHKPITGYGYGLFEKEYNLFQAEYFRTKPTTVLEKTNARYVFMPYNDLLEQGIQGGMLGMLLFLSVVVLFIFQAFKQKNTQLSSILLSVAVMSFVNFGVQDIPVWMLFLTCGAALKSTIIVFPAYSKTPWFNLIHIAGLTVVFFIGLDLSRKLEAQEKLPLVKRLNKSFQSDIALKLISSFSENAGTSEAYYKTWGKTYLKLGRFEEAIYALKKATLYSSSPSIYFDLAYCYQQTSQVKKSEECLILAKYIVPTNYTSRIMLMQLYKKMNEQEKMIATAQEIISLPIKQDSMEILKIKKYAMLYIKK